MADKGLGRDPLEDMTLGRLSDDPGDEFRRFAREDDGGTEEPPQVVAYGSGPYGSGPYGG